MAIAAVRGAITIDRDTPENIQEAMGELLTRLVEGNGISETEVVSVFITVTQDIHSVSPAKSVREFLNWHHTPIMSAVEPHIEGLPLLCIRILIQFNTDTPRAGLQHVYLREAQALRPDLRQ